MIINDHLKAVNTLLQEKELGELAVSLKFQAYGDCFVVVAKYL